MASVFTRIVKGEIPCYKCGETEDYLAFLDVNPLKYGHILVIPKIEVDYIFALQDQELAGLMIFAKKVAIALKQVVECTRIGVTVIGLEVPHTHIHLIPIDNIGDMNFTKPKTNFNPEAMKALADRIFHLVSSYH